MKSQLNKASLLMLAFILSSCKHSVYDQIGVTNASALGPMNCKELSEKIEEAETLLTHFYLVMTDSTERRKAMSEVDWYNDDRVDAPRNWGGHAKHNVFERRKEKDRVIIDLSTKFYNEQRKNLEQLYQRQRDQGCTKKAR